MFGVGVTRNDYFHYGTSRSSGSGGTWSLYI